MQLPPPAGFFALSSISVPLNRPESVGDIELRPISHQEAWLRESRFRRLFEAVTAQVAVNPRPRRIFRAP